MVTILQITATVFSAYLILTTTKRFINKKLSILSMLFWNAVWTGIIVMSWIPGLISKLTGTNPADLVIRVSIITLFYLLFLIDAKISETKEAIKMMKEKML
jgi:hypothetical protein